MESISWVRSSTYWKKSSNLSLRSFHQLGLASITLKNTKMWLGGSTKKIASLYLSDQKVGATDLV